MRLPLGRIGLLLVLSIGLAATMFWLNEARGLDMARIGLPALVAGLLFIVSLAVPNLMVRWWRWHFLLRRGGFRVMARNSLVVWVITLPSLLTPFSVGELLRSLLLRRRYPGIGSTIALAWIVERSCDVAVLSSFYALSSGRPGVAALAPSAWLLLALLGRGISAEIGSRLLRPRTLFVVLLSTSVAWVFPVLGFWALLARLGPGVEPDLALLVFSKGSLLGGLAGLPLGIGLTGSLFVIELRAAGVELPVAIAGTALLRAGTAWFSVGLGVLSLLIWRWRVREIVNPRSDDEHFDTIAEDYRDEIPDHVRARLLERKVAGMQTWLDEERVAGGAKGLDIGCGHGWYACEVAGRGYRMWGIDRAEKQVEQARRHAFRCGVGIGLGIASASRLPFADRTFDFAYAINVLHHLRDDAARRAVLAEVVRVLEPGGLFFLHEINTRNPLFQFYMGYVFPVLRSIDEGTERWVRPDRLPEVREADWSPRIEYFTFLPEFLSPGLSGRLRGLEAALERSAFRHWSAHYLAVLKKNA